MLDVLILHFLVSKFPEHRHVCFGKVLMGNYDVSARSCVPIWRLQSASWEFIYMYMYMPLMSILVTQCFMVIP